MWHTGLVDPHLARSDLAAWRAARPTDLYAVDRHLQLVNEKYLSGSRLASLEERARQFGASVAALGPLVERYEDRHHLPELARWDGIGERLEAVRFDPAYHEAGRVVWGSGAVALAGSPGTSFEQATLMYLLSHEGEMGHGCPLTCTVGMIRALRRKASPDVAGRFLPPLLETDYDHAQRAAQFLTEVQGGSDVGTNAVRAEAAGDGTYRISGEKWFCSVADADQFLVTARVDGAPEGTAGLGCFAVPRLVDGRPNGFALRRLKEKLGTRAMASAEIDFDGALAFPIGPVEEGFKTAVTAMLNSSRWLNALGNVGMMHRAYQEAASYARHRRAFGRRIGDFPAVRSTLAGIKAEWLAALHSTWLLTALDEAVDTGSATDEDGALHRFLVNANKYLVATRATAVVHEAIEVLGGNGAIEDFSLLPRLLRDSVVFEQWEGTHNVLAAQVRRDLGKLGLAGVVFERAGRLIKGAAHPELEPAATLAGAALEDLAPKVQRSVEDAQYGAIHFRRLLGRLTRLLQVGCLMEAGDHAERLPAAAELRATADYLARTELDPAYRPEDDARFGGRVDAVLATDLAA